MNNKTKMIIGGVLIAGVFFYGGYLLAGKTKTSGRTGGYAAAAGFAGGSGGFSGGSGTGFSGQMGSRNGSFGSGSGSSSISGGSNRIGGNFAGGMILSKDSDTLTVKATDGSSRIVFWNASTPVTKTVSGTTDDLVSGQEITIIGTQNADGSITAQSIQIRPANSPMMRATSTPGVKQ